MRYHSSNRFHRVRSICLFCVVFGVPAVWLQAGTFVDRLDQAQITLDEIRRGVNTQWDKVKSMTMSYEKSEELLAPATIVKKLTLHDVVKSTASSFSFKGEKRHYKYEGPPTARDIAPKTDHDYEVIPNGREFKANLDKHNAKVARHAREIPKPEVYNFIAKKELAYNGSRVVQLQSNKMAEIQNPDQVREYAINFPDEYLANILRALPNPFDPKDSRALLRIPDILDLGGITVRKELEDVDGTPCVVLTGEDRRTIWVDPRINYGVRKCEIFFDGTPYLKSRQVNREWKEFQPGIWLPAVAIKDECGPPEGPESYRGKAIYRTAYMIRSIKINDVPDSIFELSISAGETVLDATRLPGRDGNKQHVVYTMPADAKHLDTVVKKALADRSKAAQGIWGIPAWLIAGNFVVIVIGVAIYFLRRRVKSAG